MVVPFSNVDKAIETTTIFETEEYIQIFESPNHNTLLVGAHSLKTKL